MNKNLIVFGVAVGLLSLASASYAATYTFSFSGATDSGSGTLTGDPGSPLTGITGFIDGIAIQGLSDYGLTSTPPLGNTVTTSYPYLNYNGIAFSTASDAFNIYYNNIPDNGAPEGYYLIQRSTDPTPNDPSAPFGESITFTTSVPEPASWAMMMVGLGLAGATLRRRASKVVHVQS